MSVIEISLTIAPAQGTPKIVNLCWILNREKICQQAIDAANQVKWGKVQIGTPTHETTNCTKNSTKMKLAVQKETVCAYKAKKNYGLIRWVLTSDSSSASISLWGLQMRNWRTLPQAINISDLLVWIVWIVTRIN